MRKPALFIAAAILLALTLAKPIAAPANPTASGTLAVTATVASSINLVFNTDASGVSLTGAGTNAATLAFGTVQAYGGALGANVTRTVGATSFTVSTPFDVNVAKANSSSGSYQLTAQLASVDSTNTWQVGGVLVTGGSAATITSTGAYASNVAFTLALTVPFSEAAGSISNTINFTATAN
ncbi:MAG: hypothetical protein JO101_06440 [Candidatus Eremiobacteraeota bacterium]|nr:hypothetical protein [Candidatus Eremiobacteraeota bacterium]MBV8354939.1 hypothetical protein [Candidatus Eremiobacteraeota bacterium]